MIAADVTNDALAGILVRKMLFGRLGGAQSGAQKRDENEGNRYA